ncbi:MAG: metallophosphoesterase [Thermoplasmatota archaeon]
MDKKEIFEGLYITSDKGAWYEPKKIFILSDLHLGFEANLEEDGISIPRFQKKDILESLSTILDKYDPETVIINGDLKHEFGKNKKEEFFEVMDIIDFLKEYRKLVIIRGNHDNFLKNITEKKGIPLHEEPIVIDDITVTHGHKAVDIEGLLIIGHEHPSIKIRDDMGSFIRLPCYLYHETKNILILPAFSPLAYGRDMLNSDKFISDAIKNENLENFQVYAVTDSGLMDFKKIRDIREAYPRI